MAGRQVEHEASSFSASIGRPYRPLEPSADHERMTTTISSALSGEAGCRHPSSRRFRACENSRVDDTALERERARETIFLQCERFLFAHGPQRPRAVLADLAAEAGPDEEPDHYGEGNLINDFERD